MAGDEVDAAVTAELGTWPFPARRGSSLRRRHPPCHLCSTLAPGPGTNLLPAPPSLRQGTSLSFR
jgi:hypothetical protein